LLFFVLNNIKSFDNIISFATTGGPYIFSGAIWFILLKTETNRYVVVKVHKSWNDFFIYFQKQVRFLTCMKRF
jgi:hypothetical protein